MLKGFQTCHQLFVFGRWQFGRLEEECVNTSTQISPFQTAQEKEVVNSTTCVGACVCEKDECDRSHRKSNVLTRIEKLSQLPLRGFLGSDLGCMFKSCKARPQILLPSLLSAKAQ